MALRNRAKMTTSTTGTSTITLGSADTGVPSFAAAGVADGEQVWYLIEDGSAWEIGRGTYASSGTTLARTSVLESTNSDAAISLTGAAKVSIIAPAEKLQWTLIGTVSPVSGTNADFLNIPPVYDDLMVVYEGVSADGSVSWRYAISPDSSSFSSAQTISSIAAASTLYGVVRLFNYNRNYGIAEVFRQDTAPAASPSLATPTAFNQWIWNCTGGVKAIRFSVSSGNIDAGTIRLYAR